MPETTTMMLCITCYLCLWCTDVDHEKMVYKHDGEAGTAGAACVSGGKLEMLPNKLIK